MYFHYYLDQLEEEEDDDTFFHHYVDEERLQRVEEEEKERKVREAAEAIRKEQTVCGCFAAGDIEQGHPISGWCNRLFCREDEMPNNREQYIANEKETEKIITISMCAAILLFVGGAITGVILMKLDIVPVWAGMLICFSVFVINLCILITMCISRLCICMADRIIMRYYYKSKIIPECDIKQRVVTDVLNRDVAGIVMDYLGEADKSDRIILDMGAAST